MQAARKESKSDIRRLIDYTNEVHWRTICIILADNDLRKATDYYTNWDMVELYEWLVIRTVANYNE